METLNNLKDILGVDLIGVTDASRMENILDILNKRPIEYKTKFESLDFLARTSPDLVLESASSVFVIGMSYLWEDKEKVVSNISNHARSEDYHKVMTSKLEKLAKILENEGYSSYIQVDNGKLYERELARCAGLGIIGKNGMLINNIYGSYIFLGVLVTDLKLENYSKEAVGDCGSCKECEKACPSGAILGDYKLNPKICHSYLSQIRETVDETYRINYAYGCDICQEVCPKNNGIIKNKNEEFRPKIYNINDISSLSNREFKKKYGNYSFSWVGKKTIQRNLEILEKRGS